MEKLRAWFLANRRKFPWRESPLPYAVWVSEVMLQQTRAAVVIPYFEKWMQRFPTLEALAKASVDEVVKCWEGLGYYARARALHLGAQEVVSKREGVIPSEREALEEIRGIGPYTAGAILSFAYHKRAPAVDGNVARVVSRLFFIQEEISRPQTRQRIEQLVEKMLPQVEPWVVMEALIELGALVCQKKADCYRCPMQEQCIAFQRKEVFNVPVKKPSAASLSLRRLSYIILFQGEVFIRKAEEGKVMAGLCEFPYLDEDSAAQIKSSSKQISLFGLRLRKGKDLSSVRHTFTRFRVELLPSIWYAAEKRESAQGFWVSIEKLKSLAFSSGDRRILEQLQKEDLFCPESSSAVINCRMGSKMIR